MIETTQRPFTAAAYNQYLKGHILMGTRCNKCQAYHLPPRAICNHCHSQEMEWVELSGKGKLVAFTVIVIAPTAMANLGYGKDNPYVSGIVELEEGVKISARITGLDAHQPETIVIGTPLTVDFLTQGEGDAQTTVLAFSA